jgi:hypothetical protein
MTVKLREVGRKVSGKNENSIRAAVTALVSILDSLTDPDAEGENTTTEPSTVHVGSTESQRGFSIARKNGAVLIKEDVTSDVDIPPPPTLDDVRKSLQALIDALPDPGGNGLEGDGDDDEDDGVPIIRTNVGNDALNPHEAAHIEAWRAFERTFSADQRKSMAKSGSALPDGSYPIPDADALRRAKMAFGRNPTAKVKAHINKRAKALGKPAMGEALQVTEAGLACQGCSAPVGDKWQSYCGSCGEPLSGSTQSGTHCSGCGSMLKQGENFCTGCGAEVPAGNTAKEAAAKPKDDAPDDDNATTTVHHGAFEKMSDEEQIAHLKGSHGMGVNRATMTRPGRVSTHADAHATESPTANPAQDDPKNESEITLFGDLVTLVEGASAVGRDGTIELKVIKPGWGTSGYYSPELLERDGPKAFAKGLQMYWDHPTQTEEKERPERSLDGLAGILQEDATWRADHPKGPGLYASAKVFKHYQPAVAELAPHIGVSIRALGKAKVGEAEGKKGPIVETLSKGQSLDFVTVAGAGGEILSQFAEAARITPSNTQGDDAVSEAQLKEAQDKLKEATDKLARLQEAAVLREAADKVRALLDGHGTNLPDITRDRLHRALAQNPPLQESGDLDVEKLTKAVKEAIADETDYLSKVVGVGRIRGFGGVTPLGESDQYDKDMTEAFRSIGLDENTAKIAAAGRR